jgi:hypothetical protein
MNKNTITPKIIEEGVESAKNFLSKLVTPAFEETGLLIKDQVTRWRFNNQVKMINKAKVYCEKNHINPKAVSLKLLVPLLDYSGIEEDEVMQDKWAILLSNLVDSEQNIENHVFPYILSQLSSGEFKTLEMAYDSKQSRIQRLQQEFEEFLKDRPLKESQMHKRIDDIEIQLIEVKNDIFSNRYFELNQEKKDLGNKLTNNRYFEEINLHAKEKPESIPYKVLKNFEESNLIRLGLAKEVKEVYADSQTLEIPVATDKSQETGYVNVDLEVDVNSVEDVILTELGELFISACKETSSKISNDYFPHTSPQKNSL